MTHILVLESNTLLAATYAQAFTYSGYTVAVAHDAQQAITAADERTPDVVVLELQLPGHNGVEFLHEFRSYPEWQMIPVIVNTVLPPVRMHGLRQALQKDVGVSAIFYKPTTSLEALCRAVGQAPASTAA